MTKQIPPDLFDGIIRLDDSQGDLPFHMWNDYLFRALLQVNSEVLKAFVCSLLYLEPQEVTSIAILNPIVLGDAIDDKTYILDIFVEVNGRTRLNLELQVINERNWPERSLCYLCRTFDSMNRGENYRNARTAIQIGIVNFTLFEDNPEFFSNYYMINEKNRQIYTRKFRLCVLDLTQIELATKQDRKFGLDKWAALLTAATWEDLSMLAKEDQTLKSAIVTIVQLTEDEKIRLQCEAREDYYRRTEGREELLRETEEERDQLKTQLDQTAARLDQATAERDQATAERDQATAERDLANTKLEQAATERDQLETQLNQTAAELKQALEALELLRKRGADSSETEGSQT